MFASYLSQGKAVPHIAKLESEARDGGKDGPINKEINNLIGLDNPLQSQKMFMVNNENKLLELTKKSVKRPGWMAEWLIYVLCVPLNNERKRGLNVRRTKEKKS